MTTPTEMSEELEGKRKKQRIIIAIAVLTVMLCCLCLSCFTLISRRAKQIASVTAVYLTGTPEIGGLQVLPTVTPFEGVVEQPTASPPPTVQPSPTPELGNIASPVIPTVPPASPTPPQVDSPPELLCPYQLEDVSYAELQNLMYGGIVEQMPPGCSIRVTVHQDTVDEVLPEALAAVQEAGYQDLRVHLGSGQILVTGKTQQAFLTVSVEGGVRPVARDCRLTFEIAYLKVGGVDAPQWAREELVTLVCDRVSCVWESPEVCFNSVELDEGSLTINATKR